MTHVSNGGDPHFVPTRQGLTAWEQLVEPGQGLGAYLHTHMQFLTHPPPPHVLSQICAHAHTHSHPLDFTRSPTLILCRTKTSSLPPYFFSSSLTPL